MQRETHSIITVITICRQPVITSLKVVFSFFLHLSPVPSLTNIFLRLIIRLHLYTVDLVSIYNFDIYRHLTRCRPDTEKTCKISFHEQWFPISKIVSQYEVYKYNPRLILSHLLISELDSKPGFQNIFTYRIS